MSLTLGINGDTLIKHFENVHDGDLTKIGLQPKLCPAGIYTAGWGHAIVDPKTGKFIKKDTPNGYERACELFPDLTLGQADELFIEDINKVVEVANKRLRTLLDQNQYDALISHTFNCGVSDTLYKLINTKPLDSIEIKFWWENKYISSNGNVLPGLILRRKCEYHLFSTGELNFNV
jgi:lysozyme